MPVPVLVEVFGPYEGRRIPLDRDVVLGRVALEGVTVVPNREVSRRHCSISQTNTGHILVEDLGSANGTWVNGQRTSRTQLSLGDRLALGRTVFEIRLDDEPNIDVPPNPNPITQDEGPFTADAGLSIDAQSSQFGRLPRDLGDLREVARHRDLLHRLCEISRSLATTTDLGDLADQITQATLDMFPTARRTHVVLAEGENLRLLATRARTPQGSAAVPVKSGDLPISRSILARAIRERQSISSVDAALDDRFMGMHSVVINSIRAFMCAPLLYQQEVLGAILVDTTVGSQGFTEQDLEMLTAVGAQLAVQFKAVHLINENLRQAEVRAHLSRYLSPDLVEQVIRGQVDLQLGGQIRQGAILFSDLVGFTALSEQLDPVSLVRLLNNYFSRVVDAVFRFGGSVNKFGGDSLLAVWGLTRAEEGDALAATQAGLLMQNSVHLLNQETGIPLRVGIGINRGSFVAGNVGSAERMEYTVLGDAVNLAQRVESQAGPTQVLVSPDALAPILERVGGFSIPQVRLKGKREPVTLFSVRGLRVEEGLYLTSIPTRVWGPDGSEADALISEVREVEAGLSLHLQGGPTLFQGDELTTRLDPPEFPGIETWDAQVREVSLQPVSAEHTSHSVQDAVLFVPNTRVPAFLTRIAIPLEGSVPVPRV